MKQAALETAYWSCPTVGGRKTFQVEGDVESGARIRVGASEQLLAFDRQFFERLLREFRGREVRIGSKFDDPGPGSLGEWIQKDRGVKMNPAVYVAGLLVRLGYAEYSRRGYVRFHQERVTVRAPEPERPGASRTSKGWSAKLQARLERLSQDQAEALVELIDQARPQGDLLDALAGNPAFRRPEADPQGRGEFKPLKLEGRPLSEDLIQDRR